MQTTWIKAGAGAAVAALLLTTGALHPAGAGSPPATPDVIVDPTTVSNRTPFTVSGAGCINPDTQSGEGNSVVVMVKGFGYPNSSNPEAIMYRTPSVNADGTWSTVGEPDTREDVFGPYDDFDTPLTAACFTVDPPTGEPLFEYGTVIMHYDGTRDDTTTTASTAVPTTAVPAPAPAPGGAAPATPVPGRATFTG